MAFNISAKRLKDKKINFVEKISTGMMPTDYVYENLKYGVNIWAYYRHASVSEIQTAAHYGFTEEVIFIIGYNGKLMNEIEDHHFIEFRGVKYEIQQIDDFEGYKGDIKITAARPTAGNEGDWKLPVPEITNVVWLPPEGLESAEHIIEWITPEGMEGVELQKNDKLIEEIFKDDEEDIRIEDTKQMDYFRIRSVETKDGARSAWSLAYNVNGKIEEPEDEGEEKEALKTPKIYLEKFALGILPGDPLEVKIIWEEVEHAENYIVYKEIDDSSESVGETDEESLSFEIDDGEEKAEFFVIAYPKEDSEDYEQSEKSNRVSDKEKGEPLTNELETPNVEVTDWESSGIMNDASITIEWEEVENAKEYEVKIYYSGDNEEVESTDETEFTISNSNLSSGTELTVKAMPEDSEEYEESEESDSVKGDDY